MSLQITYLGRTVAPAVGFFAPLPLFRHLCPGYGFDPLPDLSLVQLERAGPSRVEGATHVANLVDSTLKGRNPAANERRQQVISGHPFFRELCDNLVDVVDFRHFVGWVVPPIALRSRGADGEIRQVNQIDLGRVLHIEERALPSPA